MAVPFRTNSQSLLEKPLRNPSGTLSPGATCDNLQLDAATHRRIERVYRIQILDRRINEIATALDQPY